MVHRFGPEDGRKGLWDEVERHHDGRPVIILRLHGPQRGSPTLRGDYGRRQAQTRRQRLSRGAQRRIQVPDAPGDVPRRDRARLADRAHPAPAPGQRVAAGRRRLGPPVHVQDGDVWSGAFFFRTSDSATPPPRRRCDPAPESHDDLEKQRAGTSRATSCSRSRSPRATAWSNGATI